MVCFCKPSTLDALKRSADFQTHAAILNVKIPTCTLLLWSRRQRCRLMSNDAELKVGELFVCGKEKGSKHGHSHVKNVVKSTNKSWHLGKQQHEYFNSNHFGFRSRSWTALPCPPFALRLVSIRLRS